MLVKALMGSLSVFISLIIIGIIVSIIMLIYSLCKTDSNRK